MTKRNLGFRRESALNPRHVLNTQSPTRNALPPDKKKQKPATKNVSHESCFYPISQRIYRLTANIWDCEEILPAHADTGPIRSETNLLP